MLPIIKNILIDSDIPTKLLDWMCHNCPNTVRFYTNGCYSILTFYNNEWYEIFVKNFKVTQQVIEIYKSTFYTYNNNHNMKVNLIFRLLEEVRTMDYPITPYNVKDKLSGILAFS